MSGQDPRDNGRAATQAPGPTAGPAGGDPAMEDILASIRRILNEDDAPAAKQAPPEAPEPLNLTEEMLVSEMPAAPPEPPVAQAAQPQPEEYQSMAPSDHDQNAAPLSSHAGPNHAGLIAPEAAAATTAAVGHLIRAVAQERTSTVSRGGVSIEDVVREEIRPLLKEWLDQHLPPLVERLVRVEIERVVGRVIP